MSENILVTCPTCGKKIPYDSKNPYRPFCSATCQMIDLGAWANEEYLIAGEPGSAMSLSPEDYQAAAQAQIERSQKKK